MIAMKLKPFNIKKNYVLVLQKYVLNRKCVTKICFKFFQKVLLSLIAYGLSIRKLSWYNIKENTKENKSLGKRDFFDKKRVFLE